MRSRPSQYFGRTKSAAALATAASLLTRRSLDMHNRPVPLTALVVAGGVLLGVPVAHADGDNNTLIPNNKRLNDGVVANVYTVQHQAGCTNDVRISPQLQRAAQRHTEDVLKNRALDADIGSDGSTPQGRANAAGFHGPVAETVAINQSIAISGNDLLNRWYHDPAYFNIMSNCAHSQIGVWSENSPDRTVVVAVYGQPQGVGGATPASTEGQNIPLDPSPDYDASDEVEFGFNWLPWILRGVYPPPAHPPE
jgi:uncharacterized protein YkwD